MSFKRTDEQQAIAEFAVLGEDLKASAFAGCTKTTTGVLIAEDMLKMDQERRQRQRRIWYMAFNKAIAGEAARKFPANTKATTAHSPAYRSQVGRFGGEMVFSNTPVVEAIKDDRITYDAREAFTKGNGKRAGYLILKTLIRFCHSSDKYVGPQHIPSDFMATLNEPARISAARKILPAGAQRLWDELMSGPTCTIPFTPDFYFKSWVLSEPVLPFDVIFCDEFQDTNGVTLDLVLNQNCQRIYTGDSHQAIYGWRGAIDAMHKVDAPEFPLTQSFRFGPHIAAEANKILTMLGESRELIGAGQEGGLVVDGEAPDVDAILCRGNSGVLSETLHWLDAGRRVAVVGGTYEAVRQMKAAYELSLGRPADHPEIGLFNTYDELQELAGTEEGSHLRQVVRIVEDYGDKVPELARRLSTETVKETQNPDILISTAHKAKGREWPSVRIADDFSSLVVEDDEGNAYLRKEEANLLYVAITRAQVNLDLNGRGKVIAADARKLGVDLPDTVTVDPEPTKISLQSDAVEPVQGSLSESVEYIMEVDDSVQSYSDPTSPKIQLELPSDVVNHVTPLSEKDLKAMEGWVKTRFEKNDQKMDTTLVFLELTLAEIRRLQKEGA